ncbi:phosphotransferase [Variovorax sp. dw_308]|uniref:phosphotransferase n=1 Tax=Variovorax sp. dw_308 TaxID=2721546 RepID=UPI001C439C1C|nr:phosphotransferase [Variovorax sp. dw_308]
MKSIFASGFDLSALADVMNANGLPVTGSLQLSPLTGGQSNPTFRLTTADRTYVLRKRPTGDVLASAHAIDREFRVMSALRQTAIPVPEMYFYCKDESIVGTPFYLMEFLDGRIFVDQSLPGLAMEERRDLYLEMNRVIAELHKVQPESIGLADYGRVGNYLGRQIARWTRQYQDSNAAPIPAMDRLIEWLPGHVPQSDRTSLVHGDFRVDNLVFHPVQPRVIGILDWELSTLGDPLADFAYHCMSWHIPPTVWRGIGGLNLEALGIPDESHYVNRYLATTGNAVDGQWSFYLAYNLFRMAAILHGIARRAEMGIAASADAAEVGRKAEPLAELAWQFAERAEANAC